MKKTLILGACLVALASQPVMAQTSSLDVVTVTIEETSGVYIVISREGNSEVVAVAAKEAKQKPNVREETVRQVLAKLLQGGYILKGTYGATNNYVGRYTLIFTTRIEVPIARN